MVKSARKMTVTVPVTVRVREGWAIQAKKKLCKRLTGHKSHQSSHQRVYQVDWLGQRLDFSLPTWSRRQIDHHKLSRFVWIFNGKCIAEKGYVRVYRDICVSRRLTLIFMTCKYLWLTRPCQVLARSLFSAFSSISSSSASSCILSHTIFYDSPEIPANNLLSQEKLCKILWYA